MAECRENNESCVICLETVHLRGKLANCDHLFCFECILEWATITNTCPLCKRRFEEVVCVDRDGRQRERRTVTDCDQRGDDPDADELAAAELAMEDGEGDDDDEGSDSDGYVLDGFVVRDDDVEFEHDDTDRLPDEDDEELSDLSDDTHDGTRRARAPSHRRQRLRSRSRARSRRRSRSRSRSRLRAGPRSRAGAERGGECCGRHSTTLDRLQRVRRRLRQARELRATVSESASVAQHGDGDGHTSASLTHAGVGAAAVVASCMQCDVSGCVGMEDRATATCAHTFVDTSSATQQGDAAVRSCLHACVGGDAAQREHWRARAPEAGEANSRRVGRHGRPSGGCKAEDEEEDDDGLILFSPSRCSGEREPTDARQPAPRSSSGVRLHQRGEHRSRVHSKVTVRRSLRQESGSASEECDDDEFDDEEEEEEDASDTDDNDCDEGEVGERIAMHAGGTRMGADTGVDGRGSAMLKPRARARPRARVSTRPRACSDSEREQSEGEHQEQEGEDEGAHVPRRRRLRTRVAPQSRPRTTSTMSGTAAASHSPSSRPVGSSVLDWAQFAFRSQPPSARPQPATAAGPPDVHSTGVGAKACGSGGAGSARALTEDTLARVGTAAREAPVRTPGHANVDAGKHLFVATPQPPQWLSRRRGRQASPRGAHTTATSTYAPATDVMAMRDDAVVATASSVCELLRSPSTSHAVSPSPAHAHGTRTAALGSAARLPTQPIPPSLQADVYSNPAHMASLFSDTRARMRGGQRSMHVHSSAVRAGTYLAVRPTQQQPSHVQQAPARCARVSPPPVERPNLAHHDQPRGQSPTGTPEPQHGSPAPLHPSNFFLAFAHRTTHTTPHRAHERTTTATLQHTQHSATLSAPSSVHASGSSAVRATQLTDGLLATATPRAHGDHEGPDQQHRSLGLTDSCPSPLFGTDGASPRPATDTQHVAISRASAVASVRGGVSALHDDERAPGGASHVSVAERLLSPHVQTPPRDACYDGKGDDTGDPGPTTSPALLSSPFTPCTRAPPLPQAQLSTCQLPRGRSDERHAVVSDERRSVVSDERRAAVSDEFRAVVSDEPHAVVSDEPRAVVSDERRSAVSDEHRVRTSNLSAHSHAGLFRSTSQPPHAAAAGESGVVGGGDRTGGGSGDVANGGGGGGGGGSVRASGAGKVCDSLGCHDASNAQLPRTPPCVSSLSQSLSASTASSGPSSLSSPVPAHSPSAGAVSITKTSSFIARRRALAHAGRWRE